MIITVEMLKKAGACEIDGFRHVFGESAKVTKANCLKATKARLDLDWAAKKFFEAPAREAYYKATATAWKAYYKATAPAFYEASKLNQHQG